MGISEKHWFNEKQEEHTFIKLPNKLIGNGRIQYYIIFLIQQVSFQNRRFTFNRINGPLWSWYIGDWKHNQIISHVSLEHKRIVELKWKRVFLIGVGHNELEILNYRELR